MEKADPGLVERVVLTGFMGSGKSTVGRLLAQRLAWDFLDLDAVVESRCNQTVSGIFAQYGEAHFRAEEAAALRPMMQNSKLVIALGGGAVGTPAVQELLQFSVATAVIFLDAPFDTLQDRCSKQAARMGGLTRPLMADLHNARERFAERQDLYSAVGRLRIDTTEISPDEAAATILQQLATNGHRRASPLHLKS